MGFRFLGKVRPFTSPRRGPSTGSDHCSPRKASGGMRVSSISRDRTEAGRARLVVQPGIVTIGDEWGRGGAGRRAYERGDGRHVIISDLWGQRSRRGLGGGVRGGVRADRGPVRPGGTASEGSGVPARPVV